MRIDAEFDDVHAKGLLTLQQRMNKSASEIIADLIDANWNQSSESQAGNEVSPIYQAFEAAGLISCIATGEQLSANYKEKLDFSNKTGMTEE